MKKENVFLVGDPPKEDVVYVGDLGTVTTNTKIRAVINLDEKSYLVSFVGETHVYRVNSQKEE